jgi:hypothetical protein
MKPLKIAGGLRCSPKRRSLGELQKRSQNSSVNRTTIGQAFCHRASSWSQKQSVITDAANFYFPYGSPVSGKFRTELPGTL